MPGIGDFLNGLDAPAPAAPAPAPAQGLGGAVLGGLDPEDIYAREARRKKIADIADEELGGYAADWRHRGMTPGARPSDVFRQRLRREVPDLADEDVEQQGRAFDAAAPGAAGAKQFRDEFARVQSQPHLSTGRLAYDVSSKVAELAPFNGADIAKNFMLAAAQDRLRRGEETGADRSLIAHEMAYQAEEGSRPAWWHAAQAAAGVPRAVIELEAAGSLSPQSLGVVGKVGAQGLSMAPGKFAAGMVPGVTLDASGNPVVGDEKSYAKEAGKAVAGGLVEAGVMHGVGQVGKVLRGSTGAALTPAEQAAVAMGGRVEKTAAPSLLERAGLYGVPEALAQGRVNEGVQYAVGLHDSAGVLGDLASDDWQRQKRALVQMLGEGVGVGLAGGVERAHAAAGQALARGNALEAQGYSPEAIRAKVQDDLAPLREWARQKQAETAAGLGRLRGDLAGQSADVKMGLLGDVAGAGANLFPPRPDEPSPRPEAPPPPPRSNGSRRLSDPDVQALFGRNLGEQEPVEPRRLTQPPAATAPEPPPGQGPGWFDQPAEAAPPERVEPMQRYDEARLAKNRMVGTGAVPVKARLVDGSVVEVNPQQDGLANEYFAGDGSIISSDIISEWHDRQGNVLWKRSEAKGPEAALRDAQARARAEYEAAAREAVAAGHVAPGVREKLDEEQRASDPLADAAGYETAKGRRSMLRSKLQRFLPVEVIDQIARGAEGDETGRAVGALPPEGAALLAQYREAIAAAQRLKPLGPQPARDQQYWLHGGTKFSEEGGKATFVGKGGGRFEVSSETSDYGAVTVTAKDANGNLAGAVTFYPRGDGAWKTDLVQVPERFRRQGVSRAMYDYFHERHGIIGRSDYQTPEGAAMWAGSRAEWRGLTEQQQRSRAENEHAQQRASDPAGGEPGGGGEAPVRQRAGGEDVPGAPPPAGDQPAATPAAGDGGKEPAAAAALRGTASDNQLIARFERQLAEAEAGLKSAFPHGRPEGSQGRGYDDRAARVGEARANLERARRQAGQSPPEAEPPPPRSNGAARGATDLTAAEARAAREVAAEARRRHDADVDRYESQVGLLARLRGELRRLGNGDINLASWTKAHRDRNSIRGLDDLGKSYAANEPELFGSDETQAADNIFDFLTGPKPRKPTPADYERHFNAVAAERAGRGGAAPGELQGVPDELPAGAGDFDFGHEAEGPPAAPPPREGPEPLSDSDPPAYERAVHALRGAAEPLSAQELGGPDVARAMVEKRYARQEGGGYVSAEEGQEGEGYDVGNHADPRRAVPRGKMSAGMHVAEGMGASGGYGESPPPPPEAPGAAAPGGAPPEAPVPPSGYFRKFADWIRSFGQAQFPAVHRLSREAGEALSRAANAPAAAKSAWDYFSNVLTVGGKRLADLTAEQRREVGAVWLERRFRQYREHLDANDLDSSGVRTLVGQEGSPIRTEAEYQEALGQLRPFFEAVKQEWTPEVEKNYRGLKNLEPGDAIESPSQVPGLPLNAIAVDPESGAPAGVVRTGARQGMQNLRLRRPGFTKAAELSAPAYDIDVGHMMRRTLALGVPAARRAEFVRRALADGVIVDARGARPPEGYRYLGLDPARGLSGLDPAGQYYAHPDAYKDVVQGLGIGERPGQALADSARKSVDLLYSTALLSPAELSTHLMNHATALFEPGMGVPLANFLTGTIPNAYKVLARDPVALRKLADLAAMGAAFDHAPHGGLLESLPGDAWQKAKLAGPVEARHLDPTHWLNRFSTGLIGLLQKSVRLQLADAYDRLADSGQFPKSEAAKRDFINRAAGNYNAQAGNRWTQFFKDTGLQSFATASSTFYSQGLRRFASAGTNMNAPPTGVPASGRLRAVQLAKMAPFLALGPALNAAFWGQAFPRGVPSFAVKTGTRKDENGNDVDTFWDPLQPTGLRRGARAVGASAGLEALREGKPAREAGNAAVHEALQSFEHLFEGLPVQVGHTFATGEDAMDRRVVPYRRPGQGKDYWENAKAAGANVNPIAGAAYDRAVNPRTFRQDAAAGLKRPFGFGERKHRD